MAQMSEPENVSVNLTAVLVCFIVSLFFMKMYFDCTIIAKIYQYCTILHYRGAEFQAEARKSRDCGFNKKGPL